jgi:hypothetical protein
MRKSIWLFVFALAPALYLAGCGERPPLRTTFDITPECELFRATAEAKDTITVALFDAIEPDIAPWARNPGEEFLFRHLYETLVTVDCNGNVRGALATSWHRDATGRRWVFELRKDARFWDGSKVTASDVAKSWRELAVEPETISAVIDSVAVEDDRKLHVYFSRPQRDMPYALSMLEFAVVKSSESSSWPIGSGPYRIVSVQKRTSTNSQRAIKVEPATGAEQPVIDFTETRRSAARDLLEGAADVMVTGDPVVLAYAAERPQLSTAPLPWNRTYVLVSTSRAAALRENRDVQPVSPHLSNGLARDAVRADARGCSIPDWWIERGDCAERSAPPGSDVSIAGANVDSSAPVPFRILYDLDDPTARELAERIVALAATGPDTSVEAAAVFTALPGLRPHDGPALITADVPATEFGESLRDGDDFAYIISIPRRAPDACAEIGKLINRAPWLAPLGSNGSQALIPLIDTRPHAILSGEGIALGVDWYGNVFVMSVSQTASALQTDQQE